MLVGGGTRKSLVKGKVDDGVFLKLGMDIIFRRMKRTSSRNLVLRRFREHFGCDPEVVSYLWTSIRKKAKPCISGSRPVHLLWALLFMKVYCIESVMCSLCGGVDEKTFRKWSKIFVIEIAQFAPKEVSFYSFSFRT